MAVNIHFDAVPDLNHAARYEIFSLLDRHFTGVDEHVFAADLATKTHVLRIFDARGQLAGFSTLEYRRRTMQGESGALVYSGDTIVDPAAWVDTNLGPAWVAAILGLHAEAGPLWWLVLTSGVRTYRYLTVCVRRYAPAPIDRLDEQAASLLSEFASERFGPEFNADAGVVRFTKPQRLREHLADIPDHIRSDPAVHVFLTMNPHHTAGDELVSLCRLDPSNLTAVGLLALRRGRRSAITPKAKAATAVTATA